MEAKNNQAPESPHQFVRGVAYVGSEAIKWTLEIPDELKYDCLGVIMPGFGGIKQVSGGLGDGLAHEGMASVRYTPGRGGALAEMVADPHDIHVKVVHAVMSDVRGNEKQIQAKVKEGPSLNINKQVLLPHSMSGLAAPEYALQAWIAVYRIINLAGVGYGHPRLGEIFADAKGTLASFEHELVPGMRHGDIRVGFHNLFSVIHYYARLRALFEARSCLSDDARPKAEQARQRGIKIGYNAYQYDILVRPGQDVAEHVDDHIVVAGLGHLGPIVKGRKTAYEAVKTYNRLEEAA